MSFRLYVSTNQLIRNLTKLFKDVEDYPKTKLGTPRIAIQYQNNKVFQGILWKNLVQEWNNLGPAFNVNSKVMQQMKVNPGSGAGNKGVAAYQAGFNNTNIGTQAFKIAEIWNKGGSIYPRNARFLTQPMSKKTGVKASPRFYNTDPGGEFTAFVDKNKTYVGSRDSRISQDVAGMLYIRERKQPYIPRKKGEKLVRQTNLVAKFLLLNSQTHKATRWIDIAAKKTRAEVLPIILETGRKYIASQKVLS